MQNFDNVSNEALELLARTGNYFAQEELSKRCMGFAKAITDDEAIGVDQKLRREMMKTAQ